mmetsp:Transcript_59461/g.169085  ORF Transcript_59461/g.169085 Transcript_59461/m.169085 type:complete len:275 (-) Transcript_59461:1079-1903(-)
MVSQGPARGQPTVSERSGAARGWPAAGCGGRRAEALSEQALDQEHGVRGAEVARHAGAHLVEGHDGEEVRGRVQPHVPVPDLRVEPPRLLPEDRPQAVGNLRGGDVRRLVQEHEVVAAEALVDLAEVVVHVALRRQTPAQLAAHVDEHDLVLRRADDVGEDGVAVDVGGELRPAGRLELLEEAGDAGRHLPGVDAELQAERVVELAVLAYARGNLGRVVGAEVRVRRPGLARRGGALRGPLGVDAVEGLHEAADPGLHEQPVRREVREGDPWHL